MPSFFSILIAAFCLALLVLAWCFLQTYNNDQRKTSSGEKAAQAGCGAVVVCRRADVSAAGELLRYVTFDVKGKGRTELAIPDGYDDDVLTPGNQGILQQDESGFVSFVQSY